MTCLRCGEEGHDLQYCYAPFSKAWVGQNAAKIRVKLANGRTVDYEVTLSDEQVTEHLRRYESIRGGAL